MIWILWILVIVLEAISHWYVIEIVRYDITPDKISVNHFVIIGYRMLIFSLLYYFFGIHEGKEFVMYLLGALFTHLLIFPILLNKARGLRPHYLGKGFTDRILATLPFIARVWFLLVLSIGMIYGYYNTDLL